MEEKTRVSRLFAERTGRMSSSIIRELCKLAVRGEVVSLAGGWPNSDAFPYAFTAKAIRKYMKEKKGEVLQYGTSDGVKELREWLAGWLKEKEGIETEPDGIMISAGAQNGMDLCCRVFVNEGEVCLVELPTYFGGVGSIRFYGGVPVGVKTDDEGVVVDEVERVVEKLAGEGKRVKLMYIQPNYHNPLGVTLSEERREKLLEVARKFDFVLMEDNPYGDLCYDGMPSKPLKSMDRDGRVVYIKSFAKVFSPGIRLAAVVAHPEVVAKMVVARQFVDCCPPTLSQYLFLEFCRSGMLERHIVKLRKFYGKRMKKMIEHIEKYFPQGIKFTRPRGGFFVFVYLPDGLDADAILEESMKGNVAFVPGKQFFVDGSGSNTLRLSFSQAPEEKMEEAIRSIGEILAKKVK